MWGDSLGGTWDLQAHTEPPSLKSDGAWQGKATGRFELKQAPGKCLPFSSHSCAQTTNSPSISLPQATTCSVKTLVQKAV